MNPFCKFSFDGLGTECGRCKSWRRGAEPPDCPPYVTRSEPDGDRLPHITTVDENRTAHRAYLASLDPEWAE